MGDPLVAPQGRSKLEPSDRLCVFQGSPRCLEAFRRSVMESDFFDVGNSPYFDRKLHKISQEQSR